MCNTAMSLASNYNAISTYIYILHQVNDTNCGLYIMLKLSEEGPRPNKIAHSFSPEMSYSSILCLP